MAVLQVWGGGRKRILLKTVMCRDKLKEDERVYDELKVIAHNIAEIRSEKHMTQEQVAEKTGLTCRTLSNIEHCNTSASVESIIRIAEALGVPVVQLFSSITADENIAERISEIFDSESERARNMIKNEILALILQGKKTNSQVSR